MPSLQNLGVLSNLLHTFISKLFLKKNILVSKLDWNINNKTITLNIPYFSLNTPSRKGSFHHSSFLNKGKYSTHVQSNKEQFFWMSLGGKNQWLEMFQLIQNYLQYLFRIAPGLESSLFKNDERSTRLEGGLRQGNVRKSLMLTRGQNKGYKLVLKLKNIKYPFMDTSLLSQYISYLSELKKRQGIKTWIRNNLPLTLDSMNKKEINLHNLPSYIKGIKIIIEGRTQFISMKSRKLKYLFIWGKTALNHDESVSTHYSASQIMSKQGYFSVKVWISTTQ